MAKNDPFAALIELVSLDQAIKVLHDQVILFEHEKYQLNQQKEALQDKLIRAQERLSLLRGVVEEHELKMGLLYDQLKEKSVYLERIINPKEYQHMLHEVKRLKYEQNEMENILLSSLNKAEVAQKEADSLYKAVVAEQNAIDSKINELSEKIVLLQKDIAQKENDRTPIELLVVPEWIEKYRAMRARVADPVVPVVDNLCSSCFYTISDRDLQELRQHKLLQCKECYRFLYLEREMEA